MQQEPGTDTCHYLLNRNLLEWHLSISDMSEDVEGAAAQVMQVRLAHSNTRIMIIILRCPKLKPVYKWHDTNWSATGLKCKYCRAPVETEREDIASGSLSLVFLLLS